MNMNIGHQSKKEIFTFMRLFIGSLASDQRTYMACMTWSQTGAIMKSARLLSL